MTPSVWLWDTRGTGTAWQFLCVSQGQKAARYLQMSLALDLSFNKQQLLTRMNSRTSFMLSNSWDTNSYRSRLSFGAVARRLPQQPQLGQQRGVLLGLLRGGLGSLLVLQAETLDLLQDLPGEGEEWKRATEGLTALSLPVGSSHSCTATSTSLILTAPK